MLKDQLKKLRESRNLTKKQVADSIDVTERAYITYEYGQRDISTETLNKLADFYGVTTDYLLGREPAQNPFDNLQTVEEMEADLMKRWLELKPESRMVFMQLLRDVVDADNARKAQAAEPKPNNTDYITVSSTLGEIEDRMKADKDANSKDGA